MNTITLITGAPGSGKSTVSNLVAKRFPKCIVISVDQLREMMVTGQFTPSSTDGHDDEFPHQFQMARNTAIYMAQLYASHGVKVIIDDVCVPHMFADHYSPLLTNPHFSRIILMPKLEAQLERVQKRAGPWDDVLVNVIPGIYAYLEPMPKDGWHVLDSSSWTIDQTVDEILAHISSRESQLNKPVI